MSLVFACIDSALLNVYNMTKTREVFHMAMKVQFSDNEVGLMHKALKQWGAVSQVGMAVEECAELIVALQKYINRTPKPETIDNVLSEIADVEIMLAQLRVVLEIDDDTLRNRMEDKLQRLRRIFEDGEN